MNGILRTIDYIALAALILLLPSQLTLTSLLAALTPLKENFARPWLDSSAVSAKSVEPDNDGFKPKPNGGRP